MTVKIKNICRAKGIKVKRLRQDIYNVGDEQTDQYPENIETIYK